MTPDISCASVWLQSPVSGDATCGLVRISNSVRDRQAPTLSRAKPPRAVPVASPLDDEGRGAPQGASIVGSPPATCEGGRRVALRRTTCGDFGRGDRASGLGRKPMARHPADFAAFIPSASSHHVAEPHSGPGRRPRPPGRVLARHDAQAPHPAPLQERPREAPLTNGMNRNIVPIVAASQWVS
jgi:hypothetical protein